MEFVQDNVVGTVNILDYSRKNLPNLEKFVYFSTDEIFGVAPPGVSYKEYDRYNSTNPYSASKAAAEEFCVAYENTYKMPIVVTHTMNVFGERQHPEKFIPATIQKVRDGEKVIIHADPSRTKAGTRMYIHAKDVAEDADEPRRDTHAQGHEADSEARGGLRHGDVGHDGGRGREGDRPRAQKGG
jgi:dTDP-glucose 4,6-dehydratase